MIFGLLQFFVTKVTSYKIRIHYVILLPCWSAQIERHSFGQKWAFNSYIVGKVRSVSHCIWTGIRYTKSVSNWDTETIISQRCQSINITIYSWNLKKNHEIKILYYIILWKIVKIILENKYKFVSYAWLTQFCQKRK